MPLNRFTTITLTAPNITGAITSTVPSSTGTATDFPMIGASPRGAPTSMPPTSISVVTGTATSGAGAATGTVEVSS